MKIGVVCHAGFGGSGVIATELGLALAARGHELHFFAPAPPVRFHAAPKVTFHEVPNPVHPLFPGGEYAIALASKLVQTIAREKIEVLHLHYAIPHAVSAMLAKQLLGTLKVVTTLHGTDVLTFGEDSAFAPVLRAAVGASDAVTVPSKFLRDEARKAFGVEAEVVPNFVDTAVFSPGPLTSPRGRDASVGPLLSGEGIVTHASNFRSVKRVEDVVRVFAKVRAQTPCTLALIGHGPETAPVEKLIAELGLTPHVKMLGDVADVVPVLQQSAVFMLPSQTESFGLAALEALSCGVPVVASRAGGLPEVIADGETGLLYPPGDIAGMAAGVTRLLTDSPFHSQLSTEARRQAEARFRRDPLVDHYESIYRRL
ncbi:MAG: N-acetyl-alpha-D-glucosaminyl L-malate synthase BshA [Myxococcaceae bacterium]